MPAPALPAIEGYDTVGYLGGGGFGRVFHARSAGRDVAIKIAHASPEAHARLSREYELLQLIGAPWVPRVFGTGVVDGSPFFAMELIEAPTLAARMRGPHDIATLTAWMRRLLETVDAVHAKGVVHRDLKPANIFLDDNRAILVDFGLARAMESAELTHMGAAGSALYMAPEQIAAEPATPATDVYALGVILYELATGQPPFVGDDAEVRAAHRTLRPTPPSEHVANIASLDTLVLACLAKDPARRPSVKAIATALTEPRPETSARRIDVLPAGRARARGGVLLFDGVGDPSRIASIVDAHRGLLVGVVSGVWVAAFDPSDGPRPITRARQAAESLLASRAATRAHVEQRELVVRTRPDGTRQIVGFAVEDASANVAALAPGVHVIDAPDAGARTSLREAPLVGRAKLLEQLVAEARTDSVMRTIVGEPGVGRSRLAIELEAALRPEARVVRIELTTGSEVARTAHVLLADPSPQVLGSLDATEAAALADTFGWPASREMIDLLRATPGAYRTALARAIATLLRGPLVVIIDDAHHAPPVILDSLRLATLDGKHLWTCLLSRRPLFADGERTDLPPLANADASVLVRTLLEPAIDVPQAAIDRIVVRAGGVPRVLVELCRALHETGAIKRRARGDDHYLDTDAVEQRLSTQDTLGDLDPALRAHAAVLALLAPGFSTSDADAIFEQLHRSDRATFPYDTGVVLARLVARGVIERDGAWQFANDATRDGLATVLPHSTIRRAHLAATAHFEARGETRDALTRLAPHVAASDTARGARIMTALAAANGDEGDYVVAESFYTRAIELGASTIEVLRGRGLMRYRLGRYEDALADWMRCRELATDPALVANILLDEATALDWMADTARSVARVDAAGELAITDRRFAIRLLVARGRVAWRRDGGSEAAAALLERAVALSSLDDAPYEDTVAAMVMLVFLLPQLGRFDDAETLAERTIELCEQRRDHQHLATALNNRQLVSIARGLYARAIADLERADQIGRELGIPVQRYRTQLSLADIHRRLGDRASARVHAERAREMETTGSAGGALESAAAMLASACAVDDPSAARSQIAAIANPLQPYDRCLVRIVTVAIDGTDDASLESDLVREAPDLIPELWEQRARAAQRRGDRDEARRHFATAIAAAQIHDPVMVTHLQAALDGVK